MNRCRVSKRVVSILAVATIIASCGGGGDDDGSDGDAAPDTSDSAAADSVATETSAPADADPGTTVAPTDTTSDDSGDGGAAGTVTCDTIFSMAEVEELFAEPAELTVETNDSLGQLVCDWETIEDPDTVDDFAYKLLIVQFYSGSPIAADMFFDPSIYPSPVTIEGVGDLAYSTNALGMSYNFVDGPVGGSLDYTEMDMGNFDAPKLHTAEEIEQLFRTFHDRVT